MKPTALKTLANVAILILALFVNPASQAQQSAQAVPEFDAARRQAYFDYATTHPGNALEGRTIFHNTVRASCSKCHTFDGSRKGGGPDLSAIGNKFDRTAMVRAVLFPSESIAIGYGTTQLLTTTGQLRSGILQRVTPSLSN